MQREVGHESVLVLDLFYPKLSLLQNKKRDLKPEKPFSVWLGAYGAEGRGVVNLSINLLQGCLRSIQTFSPSTVCNMECVLIKRGFVPWNL